MSEYKRLYAVYSELGIRLGRIRATSELPASDAWERLYGYAPALIDDLGLA